MLQTGELHSSGCSFTSTSFAAMVKLMALAHSSGSFCEKHSWSGLLPADHYINVRQNDALPALMYLNPTIKETSVFRNTAYSCTMPK